MLPEPVDPNLPQSRAVPPFVANDNHGPLDAFIAGYKGAAEPKGESISIAVPFRSALPLI